MENNIIQRIKTGAEMLDFEVNNCTLGPSDWNETMNLLNIESMFPYITIDVIIITLNIKDTHTKIHVHKAKGDKENNRCIRKDCSIIGSTINGVYDRDKAI